MIKIGPASSNALKVGNVVLSSPSIIQTLKTSGIPVDISEKLYKIGIYATVRPWKEESAYILTALSNPSRQYMSILKRHSSDFVAVIEKRYVATLARKSDVNANRFKDSRFLTDTIAEAKEVVASLIKFEVSR